MSLRKTRETCLFFSSLHHIHGGVVYVDLSKDKLTLKTEGSASKDKKKKIIGPKNKSNGATELT